MMKKKLPSKEKIIEVVKKRRHFLIALTAILFIAATVFATYNAVNPGLNNESVVEGEEKLKSLDIQFDSKTLKELKEEKAPSIIEGPAGRNPFTPL